MGVDAGIIRKAGAWFTYETDQLGQGKENARSFLRNNPDVAAEIERRIRLHLGIDKEDVPCLLYTSDAADERSSVDLGGRRIIKKKKEIKERELQRQKNKKKCTQNTTQNQEEI